MHRINIENARARAILTKPSDQIKNNLRCTEVDRKEWMKKKTKQSRKRGNNRIGSSYLGFYLTWFLF